MATPAAGVPVARQETEILKEPAKREKYDRDDDYDREKKKKKKKGWGIFDALEDLIDFD